MDYYFHLGLLGNHSITLKSHNHTNFQQLNFLFIGGISSIIDFWTILFWLNFELYMVRGTRKH